MTKETKYNQPNKQLNKLLDEIEQIISKIAAFDSEHLKLTFEERQKLTLLFYAKIKQAKLIKAKGIMSLVG